MNTLPYAKLNVYLKDKLVNKLNGQILFDSILWS